MLLNSKYHLQEKRILWAHQIDNVRKDFNKKENLIFSKNHSFTENDSWTFLVSQIKFVANDVKLVMGIEWDM